MLHNALTRVQKAATILYTEEQSAVCSHAIMYSSSAPHPAPFLPYASNLYTCGCSVSEPRLSPDVLQIGACCCHLVGRVRNAAEHGGSGVQPFDTDLTLCWTAFTTVPQHTLRPPMGCGLNTPATVYKILPTPVSQRCQVRLSVVSEYET